MLVADDHPLNRQFARLFLEGIGAEVTEASDGEEAVQLASEQPFDVILMDMRMPKLNGSDALRRIRESTGPNDITPIIAFTAGADADFHSEAGALGFQDVLSKPFTVDVLISTLTRATALSPDDASWELANVGWHVSDPCRGE